MSARVSGLPRCLSAALVSVVLFAPARGSATTGAAFLNVPMSVRQMGMGNVSLGEGDVLRAWANPALLEAGEKRGQAALNGASMFGEQTTFGLGGVWQLKPAWNVGALVSRYSLSVDEIDIAGDPSGLSLERSLLAAGVAGVRSFRWGRVGLQLKTVSDHVAGDSEGALAADIGAMSRFKAFMFGVAMRNVGPKFRKAYSGASEGESLPMELRAAVGCSLKKWHAACGLEFASARNRPGKIGLGAEWWPYPRYGVRVGVANLTDGLRQCTAGLSGTWRQLGLDYALGGHEIGASHRMSLSYRFGPSALKLPDKPKRKDPPRKKKVEPKEKEAKEERTVPRAEKAGKLNLAVNDFEAQNVSAGDASVIADMLRSELIKGDVFNVVERSAMEKILAEQAFQQTGCTSEECAVKLGKLLNVQRILVGSFGKFIATYMLSVRMLDVETGKVIFGDTVRGKNEERMLIGVRALSKKIARECR